MFRLNDDECHYAICDQTYIQSTNATYRWGCNAIITPTFIPLPMQSLYLQAKISLHMAWMPWAHLGAA